MEPGSFSFHAVIVGYMACFANFSSVPAASDLKKAEAARRDDRRRCVCGVVANAFV